MRKSRQRTFTPELLERRDCPSMAGCPTVSVVGGSALEGQSAVFRVSLSQQSFFPVEVNYTTSNGSAIAGVNYVAKSGTLFFPAGTKTLSVSVPTIADQIVETTPQTFSMRLSPVQDALKYTSVVDTAPAQMTIIDTTKPPPPPPVSVDSVSFTNTSGLYAAISITYWVRDAQGVPRQKGGLLCMGAGVRTANLVLPDFTKAESVSVHVGLTVPAKGVNRPYVLSSWFNITKHSSYTIGLSGTDYWTYGVTFS